MAKIYHLRDFAQLKGKDIFFDANVLIYLFWATGQHNFEQDYARVFANLLKQGNKLHVDFLVISEVINRILRIEHNKTFPTQSFKDFRNSQEGEDALNDIYSIVNDPILTQFAVVGKAFNKQDIESFLTVDELDFVDKAIVALCKAKNLVLLTNDKDFKDADVDILTNNPRFFKSS